MGSKYLAINIWIVQLLRPVRSSLYQQADLTRFVVLQRSMLRRSRPNESSAQYLQNIAMRDE